MSDSSYPLTGDPAIDAALHQSFGNLHEMRDAHGEGQTPTDGSIYTAGARQAQLIKGDIEGIGQAAESHWVGDAADIYQSVNKHLAG